MNGATAAIRELRATPYGRALLDDPCPYCGGLSEVLDHILPRARGGSDSDDNLVGACASCNKRKGPRSLLAFLLMGRIEAEPAPHDLGNEIVRLLGPERSSEIWRAATKRALP